MKVYSLQIVFILISFYTYGQTLKSSATQRLEQHASSNNCDVTIPNNPEWNIAFDRYDLKGDLAPNVNYTRRDPSSVLRVNGKYYVWYSYSLTKNRNKSAPWDLNDLYYSTSVDGKTWEEHGIAVGRGPAGSYDHRSVFTTEVFYYDGVFYLVYQAAANLDGIYNKNTIGMAYATSPDGPWTKLTNPILEPTVSTQPVFDNNAVHDPCLIFFKDKFYLYYKGEGNETPVCGLGVWNLNKQVKWGVAVSDNPTGPFTKSEYNPITNTGHEVCVWNSGEGIAIMLHQDGPEFGTIQYAEDGVNFDIMGKVNGFIRTDYSSDYPEAAGVYRHINEENSPVSGVSWGLCHTLTRSQGEYWMYLRRFESENKELIIDDSDNQGIVIESSLSISKSKDFKQLKIFPNPVKDTINFRKIDAGIYNLKIISLSGQVVKKASYDSKSGGIDVSYLNEGYYFLSLTDLKNDKREHATFIKFKRK